MSLISLFLRASSCAYEGKSALSSGWANFLGSHSFPQQSRRRGILGTEVDLAPFGQLSGGLVSSRPTLSFSSVSG